MRGLRLYVGRRFAGDSHLSRVWPFGRQGRGGRARAREIAMGDSCTGAGAQLRLVSLCRKASRPVDLGDARQCRIGDDRPMQPRRSHAKCQFIVGGIWRTDRQSQAWLASAVN